MKWLILEELTLGAVCASGGGHLATCTDISEMATLTESGGVWPRVHQGAETVEFCVLHLVVTATDHLVGVMSMWSTCKSLEEPGITYSVWLETVV